MKLKEKWWIFLIVLLGIIGLVVTIKFLPIYTTVLTILGTIFGGISGWYIRGLYDKYTTKL